MFHTQKDQSHCILWLNWQHNVTIWWGFSIKSNQHGTSVFKPVESRDSIGNKIRFYTWWPPEHYLVNVLLFSTKLFKGQLNSKCSNEIILSSKIPTKLFLDFCPEILCTSLGAFWKLFGLLGTLLSNIIIKEAYRKPQKLPGSP